ncbi:hypothetical protein OROHE_015146 [Orobanche hederae]
MKSEATKQSMAARASATRRLPTLLYLGGRFRSSEGFMRQKRRKSQEARESTVLRLSSAKTYSVPMELNSTIFRRLKMFPLVDYAELSVSKVWESKCSNPLQHFTANLSLKPKHKPSVILDHIDVDDCGYFIVYSLEEDGTRLRKYDIYPPAVVDDGNFVCGCNGLLLFENEDKELILWNPTTNEFKILP